MPEKGVLKSCRLRSVPVGPEAALNIYIRTHFFPAPRFNDNNFKMNCPAPVPSQTDTKVWWDMGGIYINMDRSRSFFTVTHISSTLPFSAHRNVGISQYFRPHTYEQSRRVRRVPSKTANGALQGWPRDPKSREVKVNNESENQSPPGPQFALILLAVLTSLFLAALVCYFFFRCYFLFWTSDSSRTGRLSQQLCRASRTNSTLWTT